MSTGFSWSKVLGEPEAATASPAAIEPETTAPISQPVSTDPEEFAPPRPKLTMDLGESAPPTPKVSTDSESRPTIIELPTEPAQALAEKLIEEISTPAPRSKTTDAAALAGHDEAEILDATTVTIDEVLRMAMKRGASDIHFTVGLPPMIRHDGEMMPLPIRPLTPADVQRLVYSALTPEHLERFEADNELDFAYSVSQLARFRFNAYVQRGSVAAALRVIATKIPSFETLGLPPVIRELTKRTSGLVLVTGPTGSGKSTTIASIIDDINGSRTSHILTIEDPIEYLHDHKKCMVNQRELHSDTASFKAALRAVLREDPDIVLVGEMRDLETIEAALTLSETGHLVFGTLHTRNAPSTVDRIIDVFPTHQQDQIRVLLGNTLEAVIAQQLLPKLGGGRAAAIEVMLGTPAIKNLVREGKTHQMYSVIETSKNLGMQTMDSSLANHFRSGACSYEECLMRSVDKDSFARMAKGG